MDPENEFSSICCLPDEIIEMILQQNDYREVIHFGTTCKRFNELVKNSNVLWKNIYKKIFPEMLEIIQKYENGNWYKEVKDYFKLRKVVYAGLTEATTAYYLKIKPTHFHDVCCFMNVFSITKNQNLYYTITILQDMIKQTRKNLDGNTASPPYTLTEMYYAKTALRYYFHAYLAFKWITLCSKIELELNPPPLTVVNFFVQWVYNADLEADEVADMKISELADKVDEVLKGRTQGVSVRDPCVRRAHRVSDQMVLSAVSHVLYQQRHFVSGTETANFDTLDITKVLENKCGHHIVLLAIYHAVAMKLGVVCELHVFPNHLYIEWRQDWDDPMSRGFIVDVSTGALKPKGGCPFSRNPINSFRYNHVILMECLYTEYHRTMGYINDWYTQNSIYLTEYLGTGNEDLDSAYRNLPKVILSHRDFPQANETPLELKYLSSTHLGILLESFRFNAGTRPFFRDETLNRHPSCIQFAVGMICAHKTTHFKCVILGWSTNSRTQSNLNIPQLRYFVIDMDKSTRYVDQEYLIDLKHPSRLTHLEDALAPEFTHFDGFRYVPNKSKKSEYPDDDAIALMYKSRAGM